MEEVNNKKIKPGTILKVLILVIIAAVIFAGGYYLNGYQNKKQNKKEALKEELPMEERYPDIKFATKKIAENEITQIKIEDNGLITAINKSDKSTINVNIEDYNDNANAIIEFQYGYQSGVTHYALHTSDNEIFIAEYDPNENTGEMVFKKIKTKSEYIGIAEEEIINSKKYSGTILNPLFIYRKDAMYLLDCYEGKISYGQRYGKRYHTGAWNDAGSILLLVKGSNNKLYFLEDLETIKIRKLKYKLKDITVKFIMQAEDDTDGVTYTSYVVTTDNKILLLKLIGEDTDSYQEQINNIKLYKTGVENIVTNSNDMSVSITYEDGSMEKFEGLSSYQEYKPIEK